jgi:hypothetical protein
VGDAKDGDEKLATRSERREVSDGKWATGSGRQEVGDEKWALRKRATGSGRCERGQRQEDRSNGKWKMGVLKGNGSFDREWAIVKSNNKRAGVN